MKLNQREPGVGAVLAHSAIETIVSRLIQHLISVSGASEELWRWILERESHYHKTPSLDEQINVIIPQAWRKAFKGRQGSLVDVQQAAHWQE